MKRKPKPPAPDYPVPCEPVPGPYRVEIGCMANTGRVFVKSWDNGTWKPWVAELHAVRTEACEDADSVRIATAALLAEAPTMLRTIETLCAEAERLPDVAGAERMRSLARACAVTAARIRDVRDEALSEFRRVRGSLADWRTNPPQGPLLSGGKGG